MEGQPTLQQASSQLQNVCVNLENMAQQTVAHRRKFQFAISQLRQFVDHFKTIATPAYMNREQYIAFRYICVDAYTAYAEMFKLNALQSWAQTALENKSSMIPTELCTITSNLQEKTAPLDIQGSLFFNASSPQWLNLHLLDLKAISSSFNQFMKAGNQDPIVMEYVKERLASINVFLGQYNDSQAVAPGLAVFSPIPVTYQKWRLKHTDLIETKEIGSGVSAVVYAGTFIPTGEKVAIKKLKFKKLSGAKLQAFQRELSILASAHHPTVLRFIGATDTAPFSIVTEWMPGSSLYHDIHQNHTLDATDRTIALFDIARGMRFLHSRNIIHRDLKSLNVLIDGNKRAKICDFGFSREVNENELMTMNVGTPHWMAPELLADKNGTYNSKVDVYAYGILMWEVAARDLPYRGLEATQIIAQVMINDLRPMIPKDCPQAAADLIKKCWDRDLNVRPTFNEIVRKFRTGSIYMAGADIDKVMKYIKETGVEEEDQTIDNLKSQMSTVMDSDVSLEAFISTIEAEGVPVDHVDSCWETMMKFSDRPEMFYRGVIPFLQTRLAVKAANALMEAKELPSEITRKLAFSIPTGDESVDKSLVIAACKNGCAAQALLRAVVPAQTKLALEVIAQRGVSEEDKNDVIAFANRNLDSDDQMLAVSCLRMLIGVKSAKTVKIDTLKSLIESGHSNLRIAALLTAAAQASEGVSLPLDLIESLAATSTSDPYANTVLIAACQDRKCGTHLVDMIRHGLRVPTEIALRMLAVATAHRELAREVAEAAKMLPLMQIPAELRRTQEKIAAGEIIVSKNM